MNNAVEILKHYCGLSVSQLRSQLNHIDYAFLSEEQSIQPGQGARVHRVFAMGPIAGDYTSVGWVLNCDATNCMICSVEFGILRGIHHCRACGNVICDVCSKNRAVIEELRALGPQRVCSMCYWGQETVRTKPLVTPNTIAIVERAIKFCSNEKKQGQLNGLLRRIRGKMPGATSTRKGRSIDYSVDESVASFSEASPVPRSRSSIVHMVTPTEELIRQARELAEEESRQRLSGEALRREVEEEQAQRAQRESRRWREHVAIVEAEKHRLSQFEEAVLGPSLPSESSIIRALQPEEESEMKTTRATLHDIDTQELLISSDDTHVAKEV